MPPMHLERTFVVSGTEQLEVWTDDVFPSVASAAPGRDAPIEVP